MGLEKEATMKDILSEPLTSLWEEWLVCQMLMDKCTSTEHPPNPQGRLFSRVLLRNSTQHALPKKGGKWLLQGTGPAWGQLSH